MATHEAASPFRRRCRFWLMPRSWRCSCCSRPARSRPPRPLNRASRWCSRRHRPISHRPPMSHRRAPRPLHPRPPNPATNLRQPSQFHQPLRQRRRKSPRRRRSSRPLRRRLRPNRRRQTWHSLSPRNCRLPRKSRQRGTPPRMPAAHRQRRTPALHRRMRPRRPSSSPPRPVLPTRPRPPRLFRPGRSPAWRQIERRPTRKPRDAAANRGA